MAIQPCLPRPELFSRHFRTWSQLVSSLRSEQLQSSITLFLEPPRPGDLGSVLRSCVMHGIKWVVVLGDLSRRLIFDALRAAQLGRELAGSEVYLIVNSLEDSTKVKALAELRALGVGLVGIRTAAHARAAAVWDFSLGSVAQGLLFVDTSEGSESDKLEIAAALDSELFVPNVGGSRLNTPVLFEAVAYENHRQATFPEGGADKGEEFASPLALSCSDSSNVIDDLSAQVGTLTSMFPTHSGCADLHIAEWDAFLQQAKNTSDLGTLLVLCASQHAGNLGAILQSCAAHLIEVVIVLGGLTPAYIDKACQVACLSCKNSGVLLVAAPEKVSSAESCQELRKLGYCLVGFTESEESVRVWDFNMLGSKKALIFGKEQGGIPDDAVALLEATSTVPQLSSKGTLNVSSAVEAVLLERHRQLHCKQDKYHEQGTKKRHCVRS